MAGKSQYGTLTPHSDTAFVKLISGPMPIGNYTIQFSVIDPNPAAGNGAARPVAEITWCVQGNNIRRLVDVVDGMSITGTCESVDITVRDETVSPAPADYKVSIQISSGTRSPVQQPPTLSTAEVNVGVGTLQTIDIPAGAGVISVFLAVAPQTAGDAIADDDLVAKFSDGFSVFKQWTPARYQGWMPIYPGSTMILVQSGAAAKAAVVQATFGIDG